MAEITEQTLNTMRLGSKVYEVSAVQQISADLDAQSSGRAQTLADAHNLSVNLDNAGFDYGDDTYPLSAMNFVKMRGTFTNREGEVTFFVLQPRLS